MYREQCGEYAYWVLGVKGENENEKQINKQQQHNKDSVSICAPTPPPNPATINCYQLRVNVVLGEG